MQCADASPGAAGASSGGGGRLRHGAHAGRVHCVVQHGSSLHCDLQSGVLFTVLPTLCMPFLAKIEHLLVILPPSDGDHALAAMPYTVSTILHCWESRLSAE